MKYILPGFLILLIICSCNHYGDVDLKPCDEADIAYYSDYFVFIADDGGSRLVIPMDFNWRPASGGYNIEFKSWYGTSEEWPIAYLQENLSEKPCAVPGEVWEHRSVSGFRFEEDSRQIVSQIDGAPQLRLTIPDSSQWTGGPDASKTGSGLFACKTSASVAAEQRNGWLIYERIRRKKGGPGGGGDFSAFLWMPLVIEGDLYHFVQRGEDRSASRWTEGNNIQVESLPEFEMTILSYSSDSVSGRDSIPQKLQITAVLWSVDHSFVSTGSQVGYGPEFPNGLAYYRQSMLEPANPGTNGYGMLELILEDD